MIACRAATVEDAPIIDALFRASFTETFGHLYAPDDLAAFLAGFTEAAWQFELSDPRYAFRIAQEDGGAIGYAKLGPTSLPHVAPGPAIELRQFYLLSPWQGRGVAGALMEWVLAEARRRGARDLYLSVFVDNHRAKRFYARYGFTYVGPYAFMVGNHADEDQVLRLSLKDDV
ncbi:MAG TPA: GNAT family N-acetyltransferase [Allosphingosinicella sp.]|nr:GNAT family N-acetyltransferase [Allosphingosinicella sp.]